MSNLFTIAYFEIKRILRDWRLTAIVISQPLIIVVVLSLAASHYPSNINIGVVNEHTNYFSEKLVQEISKSPDLVVKKYSKVDENEIKSGKLRGFVVIDIDEENEAKGNVTIINDASGQYVKLISQPAILQAISVVSESISKNNIKNLSPNIIVNEEIFSPLNTEIKSASALDIKFTDYYGSAMMVLLILLVIINLSAISVTSERMSGTFERLFVTPYSKSSVIFGKALALFLVGIVISLVGNLTLALLFHVIIANIFLTIIINLLVVATSITLGLLVSSITYTVVESVQLAMYIFFISVLSTSIFSPIEVANKYFVYFIKIIPFYYAVDALRRINMSGAGWSLVSKNVYILFGSFILFLILSIAVLRREAK